jgi:hypothetical protein
VVEVFTARGRKPEVADQPAEIDACPAPDGLAVDGTIPGTAAYPGGRHLHECCSRNLPRGKQLENRLRQVEEVDQAAIQVTKSRP